nr:ORF 1 [Lactococcus lactis subsp. lactis]
MQRTLNPFFSSFVLTMFSNFQEHTLDNNPTPVSNLGHFFLVFFLSYAIIFLTVNILEPFAVALFLFSRIFAAIHKLTRADLLIPISFDIVSNSSALSNDKVSKTLFFSSAIFYSFKFQYILLYHKILFCAVLIYISINFDQVTKSFEIPWSKLTLVITGLEGILTKLPNYHMRGRSTPGFFQIPNFFQKFSSATARQNCKQF